jgi:hypothetical protein
MADLGIKPPCPVTSLHVEADTQSLHTAMVTLPGQGAVIADAESVKATAWREVSAVARDDRRGER